MRNRGSLHRNADRIRHNKIQNILRRRRIRERLEEHNIESRPIWKPLHQQPVFADCPRVLTGAADALFVEGLCLPSGPAMDEDLVDHVTQVIHGVLTSR